MKRSAFCARAADLRRAVLHAAFTALFFAAPLFPLRADVFSFRADSMAGGRASGREITVLQGNAEVRSDTILLRADRIEIQGSDNQFIDCIGRVSGIEEDKEIIFQTDRMRYDRRLKIARLEGDSSLEDKRNQIVVRGRYIEYDDREEIIVFQIAVRLFKDDMVCRSDYAVYRRREKLLELSGFPVVYKKSDEFRADRIRVDLDSDDVFLEGAVTGSIQD